MQNIEGKRERIYRKGEVLFKEGDPASELYIVQSGEITVFRTKDGRHFELGTLSKGSVLGELALIDNKPRSASAAAKTDTRVVYIDKDHFSQQLDRVPSWMAAIFRIIIKRLRDTNVKLQKSAGRDLSGRLARMLEYVYHRHRERGDGGEYITMDRANTEITAMSDIRLEQLGELYEGLVKRSLIVIERGRITVPKPDLLLKYSVYRDSGAGAGQRMSPGALKLLNALIFYGDKMTGRHAKKVEFDLTEFGAEFEKMTGSTVSDNDLNELHRMDLVQFVREGRLVSPTAGQEAKTVQYAAEPARTMLEEQKLFLLFETGASV